MTRFTAGSTVVGLLGLAGMGFGMLGAVVGTVAAMQPNTSSTR